MSRNRFVKPEVVRLQLSEGDYVDVKKRLTHGEREDFFATIAPFDHSGLSKVDRHLLRTTRVLTYLVGWSLMTDGPIGPDGQPTQVPVPMSPDMPEQARADTIRNLDTETFDEIHKALEQHIDAMDAEAEAAKNGQSAATASAAT